MPTEQELDALLGQAVVLRVRTCISGYKGIFIKNKQTNFYAIYDSFDFYPQDNRPSYGRSLADVLSCQIIPLEVCTTNALNYLTNPQNVRHTMICSEWYFQPILSIGTSSLKPIEFKFSCNFSENISSAKKSLGDDMEFFFSKKEETNPDGSLVHKGWGDFL